VEYVSPIQLNVLAPRDPATGTVTVQVMTPNGTAQATVEKDALAPGIFVYQPPLVSDYYCACLDTSYHLTGSPTVPAHPGQKVTIFLTGLGDTNPAYPDGALVEDLLTLGSPATVLLNAVAISPSFAGMSATAAGLYQINFKIPDNMATGDLLLAVQVGGQQTQDGVFLAVSP
jgi:uncharacterized protein (TIGR03437 family)